MTQLDFVNGDISYCFVFSLNGEVPVVRQSQRFFHALTIAFVSL